MNTQALSLPAVSSQSLRYQRATPAQLCVFFAGIDVVCSCFCLLLGWFWAGLRTIARQQRSILAVSKTQLRVILRAG